MPPLAWHAGNLADIVAALATGRGSVREGRPPYGNFRMSIGTTSANRRMRGSALGPPSRYKMQQRVCAAGDDIRIAGQIPAGIEQRMRVAPLPGADQHIVSERRELLQVKAGLPKIERRIEQRRDR